MKILKQFWSRRHDGVWAIVDLKGIDLAGPDRPTDSLYPIQEDIVVSQAPLPPGTIHSVTGESIVPVVAHVQGENIMRCIGTGFFVSCSGLLITAAHVIADPIEREYGNAAELDDFTWYARDLHLGVMIPTNPIFQQRGYHFYPFEWSLILAERQESPLPFAGVNLKLKSDVAICKVPARTNGDSHQPLTIVQRSIRGTGLSVGATGYAIGYAGMADVELTQVASGRIVGDFNFRLHVSEGALLEFFPDNIQSKVASTPGPCFSFAAKLPGGMSGGPIFDREGVYAHGVISKGLENEAGLDDYGFGSMLGPSMAFPISRMEGATLEQLQRIGKEGMAIISAPGL